MHRGRGPGVARRLRNASRPSFALMLVRLLRRVHRANRDAVAYSPRRKYQRALSLDVRRRKAFTAAVAGPKVRTNVRHNHARRTHTSAQNYARRKQESSARPPAKPPQLFPGPRTSRLRLPVSGATLLEYRPRRRRNDLSQRWNAGSRRPGHVLAPGQRSRRERAHSTCSRSRAPE